MAIRKTEPSDSTVDARMSGDALMSAAPPAAAEPGAREHGRLTGIHELETMIWGWSLRLLRAGAALLAGFEIICFILDVYIPPPLTQVTAALHAGAVGIAALVLALTMSKWFERNWRPVCFANLLAIYALTLALRLLTDETEPLLITLVLTLIGAGALLQWSARWQAALTAAALGAMTVSSLTLGLDHTEAAYRWVGVLIAAGLAHFILLMGERYRAELVGWTDSLRASRQELADALAQSVTMMAERERAERRLREGEAMLRKVFDAAPDNIAITRMSDGAMLEVNREFLETGYTRKEVLGLSAARLGRWSRPQLRELVRKLHTHGSVRNFETELRNKDGRVVPSLVSATMVELGGEQCVISIARDITELKRTQHELTAARQTLAVELRELEASQRRLTSSETKLRQVLEASGDAICVNRMSDGRYLDLNQGFCDVTGYVREEVIGKSALEIGIWAYREQLREYVRQLKAGSVRNFQCTYRMKGGRLAEHLVSASVVELDGEVCIVTASRDVSELKRTEHQLRAVREALAAQVRELEASESKFRRVFEATTDSLAIADVATWKLIDVNAEFLQITGLTREQVIGRTSDELGVWISRSRLKEVTELVLAKGVARNVEAEFRHRSGTIATLLFSAVMVEIDGRSCVVSIARDISALKQAEQQLIAARGVLSAQVNQLQQTQDSLHSEMAERERAQRRLQESEQTLRRIFEASLDSITIKRLSDGRYVDVNKAFFEVTGYTREEALGKTDDEMDLWTDRAHEAAVFEKIKADRLIRNVEADFRTRDGRILSALVSSAVVDLGGEPCAVSVARDISPLKQTERELIAAREAALAASEAKSHFLSVMSHEIRSPMNAILGMADLLWETPLSAEQRRYLDTMRNNSSSLLNLVNGILDLSKVESGRLNLEHADFDVVELAEDVMETLAVRAHEKGLELALRIPSTFPTALTGDPLRLRQILVNLLGNAIKFTQHGEVTLTIDAVEDAQAGDSLAASPKTETTAAAGAGTPGRRQLLRFVVRDTGIGIPADQQQAIFSNFIQADSTISRRYGGSGLGLAIVKRLVELMNGKITVESRLHEGSAFSFTIALELQPAAADARPSAPAAAARLAGKRVLVADDSSASRAILAELLALAGAEVVVAADGASALSELARARAAGHPYDAVVADNRMPEPGGAALAQKLMSASPTPHEAAVLMLTANDLTSQLAHLRGRGLKESQRCRYLVKPVRRADLWAALAAACAGVADGRGSPNGEHSVAAAGHDALRPASRSAAILKKPLRILMAEDSPDNRLLVEAYLRGTPYFLDHAENGEVAVRRFMTGHYDAILMDIQMPVMDGYEATAEIRRLEQSDHRRPTPIIALTASAHDEAVRRSLKMGCDAHVTKPVKRSTLLEAIRDAVEPASQFAPSAAEAGVNGNAAAVSEQPIVIQIDQDLSDLVPGFLTRKREDARAVLTAAEHGDPEAVARLGHKMKGEGGSYGLDAITDIGRDLEQAGKDGDFEAARHLGRDLMNFLERLEIVYRPMED